MAFLSSVSLLALKGGELPDDLLPPVPRLPQGPQLPRGPVVGVEQVVQQVKLRVAPRL
ncbi:hypothetical protein OBV_27310 [Oscillibacter valericigenes Sjm18-20]|nr:hypothetical protein OBV_27310 [Oscillibacter valericigenes Sjm18-20]